MDKFAHIPNEILAEIFVLCLPQVKYQSFDPHKAPILLTHICSSWRRFALDTPQLWKSLSLVASSFPSINTARPRFEERFLSWAESSKNQPLDLKLALLTPYVEGRRGNWDPFYWEILLMTVFDVGADRLRKLYLNLEESSEDVDHPLFHLRGECFSLLETLHLRFTLPATDDSKIRLFAVTPELQKVILDLDPCYIVPCRLDLLWSRMTHLILVKHQPDAVFKFVIQNCRILESLQIKLFGEHPLRSSSEKTTKHHLRHLRIICSGHVTPDIFLGISMPNLRTLSLQSDTNYLPSFHWLSGTGKAAHDHLFSQLGKLHSLSLGYQTIQSALLTELLLHAPAINELALDVKLDSYPAFLEALTYSSQDLQISIVPVLQILKLYVEFPPEDGPSDPGHPFTNSQFISMLRSRGKLISEDTTSDGYEVVPCPLEEVFFCAEDIGEHPCAFDVGTLRQEVMDWPELSHIAFEFTISDDKCNWMSTEVETW